MENTTQHKVGDIVYFFFNKEERRRCIVSAKQTFCYDEVLEKENGYSKVYNEKGHIHYQLKKHYWDFIDDEIYDPGLANYPRTDNWIPIEMIYSEKDFFEIAEKERQVSACSENSCEIVSDFLNDDKIHNKEFFENELVNLKKELKKQNFLLNSLKKLLKNILI